MIPNGSYSNNVDTQYVINFSIYARRLVEAGYKFIRVAPRDKRPIDIGWSKSQHFSGTEEEFIEHIRNGGNYGVKGDSERIIIDIDNPTLLEYARAQLPETFTVRSGSGRGLHFYYLCKNEGPIRLLNPENNNENWGDIQATGKQVIGPGCVHPSGGIYEIVNDVPVASITLDEIKRIFEPYIKKPREYTPEEIKCGYERERHGALFDRITLSELGCYPIKAKRVGDDIQGAHPIHGSSTGFNFAVNFHKNTWYCYRHGSGGGPLEWLAVCEGIIDCSEAGPGCLRGDRFKQVLEIARERGFDVPFMPYSVTRRPKILGDDEDTITQEDIEKNDWGIEKKDDSDKIDNPNVKIVTLEEIPDKRPDADIVLLDAPPRLGKTHHVVARWVARDSTTANVITTTHTICEHHLRIFEEHKSKFATAVHLLGKDKCCKYPGLSCYECSLYPYESEEDEEGGTNNFLEFQRDAKDYLYNVKVLTPETAYPGVCPYYLIRAAEPFADYCFTVAQNIDYITEREHWVLDEDPAIGHYFAESAPILEVTYTEHSAHAHSFIHEKWRYIEEYRKRLLAKAKKTRGVKTILAIIDILEQIKTVLEIDSMHHGIRSTILEDLKQVNITIPDSDSVSPQKILETIRKDEINECLSPFAQALLYVYKDCPFVWTGHNPATLHIVADGEKLTRVVPEGKITLIGSTRGELLIRAIKERMPDKTYKVIRVNKFPYADRFLIVTVDDINKQSNRKTFEKLLKSEFKSNTKLEERLPALVLTGTKRDQMRLISIIGGICKGSMDEGRDGQYCNFVGKHLNVFYQNSVISRGIDVEFYRVLFVYSSNFAAPYWIARASVAKERGDLDGEIYARGIMDAIIIDETTNSILRISPVRGVDKDDTLPRVVFIKKSDEWKIKDHIYDSVFRESVNYDEARKLINYMRRIGYTGNKEPDKNKETMQYIYEIFEEIRPRYGEWKKSYDVRILDEIYDAIRAVLLDRRKLGKRISEMALINRVIKRKPRGPKGKVYTIENIARIIQDMVVSGEVIRHTADGPKSLLSLRDGYVRRDRPDIGDTETQFDL